MFKYLRGGEPIESATPLCVTSRRLASGRTSSASPDPETLARVSEESRLGLERPDSDVTRTGPFLALCFKLGRKTMEHWVLGSTRKGAPTCCVWWAFIPKVS